MQSNFDSENYFLNEWTALWVLMCTVHLIMCFYQFTYAFQSEFTLCSYLNVKELLARNRRDIGRLSDSNGIWTHNHLVCKKTFNCFAKLLRVHSLMFSTLHSAIKSSRSEPNSKLCAEVSSLWARPANALVPVKRAAYFFTWCPVNRGYSWKKTHIEKKKKKIYLTDKKHSRKAHLY